MSQQHNEMLKQTVVELNKQILVIEKRKSAKKERRAQLLSTISCLEPQVRNLKEKLPVH